MADRRPIVERQLAQATERLEAHKKSLVERKLDAKGQKRDPKFRALTSEVKVFKGRLAAIQGLMDLDSEVRRLKAERLAQPKEPKVKKKKVAAPVAKAKGGGKKKAEG